VHRIDVTELLLFLEEGERVRVPLDGVRKAAAGAACLTALPEAAGARADEQVPGPTALPRASGVRTSEQVPRPSTDRSKRTLQEVLDEPDGQAAHLLRACKVRVLDRSSELAGGTVVVDRVDRPRGLAVVRVPRGTKTAEVALDQLELLGSMSAAAATAAESAAAERDAAAFAPGDYVRIIDGPHSSRHREVYLVMRALLDERYEVMLDGQGSVTCKGDELRSDTPVYKSRPEAPIPIPPPPDQSEWTVDQLRGLEQFLGRRQNTVFTGGPGKGKTELTGVCVKALLAAGYPGNVVALSNAIVSFLTARLIKMGMKARDADEVVGTYSSVLWASLGAEYCHANKQKLLAHMLAMKYIQPVVQGIRAAQWYLTEEDQNTLYYFKDVCMDMISLVCGHSGPEPAADKLYAFVMDERQIGGINVHEADETTPYGNAPGGVDVGGGESKEYNAFEAQVLQAFYPRQPVVVSAQAFVEGESTVDVPGTVVRWDMLRSRFLVRVPSVDGGSEAFAGLGSRELLRIFFVRPEHLVARSCTLANFRICHLSSRSFRVQFEAVDPNVAVHEQSPEALWHTAVSDQLHNGETDTPEVRALFQRMEYNGDVMFLQRPEVYSETRYAPFAHSRPRCTLALTLWLQVVACPPSPHRPALTLVGGSPLQVCVHDQQDAREVRQGGSCAALRSRGAVESVSRRRGDT